MQVDQAFMKMLQREEGFKLKVYPDTNNVPTIGIGHKLLKSERSSGKIRIDGVAVRYADGLSSEQVYQLCRQDVKLAVDCLNSSVAVPLSQTQFNILVSFTFNVGTVAFNNSTLLKKLNVGRYEDVPAQLKRWVFDDGVLMAGLVDRRQREADLWASSLAPS